MPDSRYNPVTNEFDPDVMCRRSTLPQLMWHITDRCPLSCPFCFATKTGRDASLSNLRDVLELCEGLGIQKIDLAGGEPLVFSGLPDVAESLHQAGIALTLTTSGFGSESNIRWLQVNAHLFARIIISFDGPSPAAHDLLRKMPGSFESLAKLIANLQAGGYDRIRINTVLVAPTLSRYLELIRTVSDLRISEWCLIQPHPANRKSSFELYSVPDETFEAAASQIESVLRQTSSPIRLLKRTASDYSGYWVLYPDGMLRRHSNTKDDLEAVVFRCDQLTVTTDLVRKLGVTLPTCRSDHSTNKEEL